MSSPVSKAQFGFYLGIVVGIPFIFLLGAIVLWRFTGVLNHGETSWSIGAERPFHARGLDCEILIYGDSTAVTGLNPSIIERATGLKTCNMAISADSMVLLNQAPPTVFLKHNQRPKFLVLAYSADDLHTWDGKRVMPPLNGIPAFLRETPVAGIMRKLISVPTTALDVLRFTYVVTIENLLMDANRGGADASMTAGDSFQTLNKRPHADCSSADAETGAVYLANGEAAAALRQQFLSVTQSYRRQYGALSDHVLVVAAPTAVCDPRYGEISKLLDGVVDNAYEEYPANSFNQAYVHFSLQGSARFSAAVAGLIRSRESSR